MNRWYLWNLENFSSHYTGYELRMTSLACCQNNDSVLSIMLHITTVYRRSASHTHQQLSWHGQRRNTAAPFRPYCYYLGYNKLFHLSGCFTLIFHNTSIHNRTATGHTSQHTAHHFHTRTITTPRHSKNGNAGLHNMALIVVIWKIHYTSHTQTISQCSISDHLIYFVFLKSVFVNSFSSPNYSM